MAVQARSKVLTAGKQDFGARNGTLSGAVLATAAESTAQDRGQLCGRGTDLVFQAQAATRRLVALGPTDRDDQVGTVGAQPRHDGSETVELRAAWPQTAPLATARWAATAEDQSAAGRSAPR